MKIYLYYKDIELNEALLFLIRREVQYDGDELVSDIRDSDAIVLIYNEQVTFNQLVTNDPILYRASEQGRLVGLNLGTTTEAWINIIRLRLMTIKRQLRQREDKAITASISASKPLPAPPPRVPEPFPITPQPAPSGSVLADELEQPPVHREVPSSDDARFSRRRREVRPKSDDLAFTGFYPAQVQAKRTYPLVVSAHLPDVIDKITREVEPFFAGSQTPMALQTTTSLQAVAIDSMLTFIPLIPGVACQPAELTIQWDAPPSGYKNVSFLMSTPPTIPGDLIGSIKVFIGSIRVGEIPVTLRPVPETATVDTGKTHTQPMRAFRHIFASYSHRDTPIVEYFRRLRGTFGDRLLVDRHELQSGDVWKKRLFEMIDQSDAFQLFWSKHSAESRYCREEWEYALQYQPTRPNFIQPVYWSKKLEPPPPPPLDTLHFAPVQIEEHSGLQTLWTQVKGLFSK